MICSACRRIALARPHRDAGDPGALRWRGRPPTDAELETLAQTWSEHCVHKTFRARINLTHTSSDGEVTAWGHDGLLGAA